MVTIKQLTFLCLLTLMFTSCLSYKPIIANDRRQDLKEQQFSKLNGTYQCVALKTNANLEEILLLKNPANYPVDKCISEKINLSFIDSTHLEVKYYRDTVLSKTRILRGHLKDCYFDLVYLGNYKLLYGIINVYSDRKARLGLLNNGNLTVDIAQSGTGTILIVPVFNYNIAINGIEFNKID